MNNTVLTIKVEDNLSFEDEYKRINPVNIQYERPNTVD